MKWRTQNSETLDDDAINVLPLDNCDPVVLDLDLLRVTSTYKHNHGKWRPP